MLGTVVAYAAWDRVEVYRLHRDISAIAARGEPVDLSGVDAPLPAAQYEEAARLYSEAAARAREIAQRDFRMTRYDVDAVIGSVNVAELEALYRPDAPALQLLDRATELPFAGFGDVVDGPDWVNIQGLQALSGLSALRADLLAYRGDGDAAAQALISAVRIQRTITDLFQRNSIGTRQFGSLRILLRHAAPSSASLEALQRAFAELPDEDGIDRDLMLRRARLLEQQTDGAYPGGITSAAVVIFHPFLVRMVRLQIEQFPEVIAASQLPWPDKYATLAAINGTVTQQARRSTPLGSIFRGSPLNLAAMSANPAAAGINLATRRVAIATLAVERYRRSHAGAPPPALAALVPALLPAVPIDPFSGSSIVYKPSADSYLVYSIDANRIDNGGVLYGTGSMSTNANPGTRDFGIKVPLTPRPVRQ
jgi:hypothetical protein